jgi:hexosaminidase
MAAVKLDVFHWHLSDDQGFRVESKRFPKLQELGSDGNFYTQDEIRQVVEYAHARAIRVVPEFDIPGHTTSWFVGYPELASAPGPYKIERTWGIFQPTMNPAREETYQFLDAFIGEMAALFPDPYFHIGGDEVEETQWKQSASIQAFAREHQLATSRDLHGYFNQRLQKIVKAHGKTMIGWDEVLAPGLAGDTVIQSWRGQEALAQASKKDYRGILSFGYYLDHLKPASFHYAVDPLPAGDDPHILGGEACMWAEYVSAETVDSRIWPRMAAIAERLWSPREVTNVPSMYARMEAVSRSLDWVGLQHRANYQPMLERLGGGAALRTLADASEATGIEIRRDARKYTSLVDLNRFPDAVRPQSEWVRHLELAAAKFAPADIAELRGAFAQWAANGLSKNLAEVGEMGQAAIEYLETHKPAPEKWISDQNQKLNAMEKPSGEVILAAVRPVRILLKALEQPVAKTDRPLH